MFHTLLDYSILWWYTVFVFSKKAPVLGFGSPLSSASMMWCDTAFTMMDALLYAQNKGLVSRVNSYRVASSDIALNRNKIWDMAKKGGCDYLFMVDTDMTLEEDCIERLLALEKIMPDCLLTGYASVGGPPHYPACWMHVESDTGENAGIIWDVPDKPFECHYIGGFGLFVPRSILYSPKLPDDPFSIQPGDRAEDFAFSRNVREAGFRIIVDPRLEFGHLRPQKVGKRHWEMQRKGLDESKYIHLVTNG